jgi:hypothetical protein
VGADGEGAPRSELGEEGPFDEHFAAAGFVVDPLQHACHAIIAVAALDGHTALPDRRNELGRVELLGDQLGEAEDLERGDRHHDRSTVGHLVEPRVDVAAQLDELEVGPGPPELTAPAYRPGRHGRSRRQVDERPTDERVGGGAPLGERRDAQPVCDLGG